jgi:hypothetical protein
VTAPFAPEQNVNPPVAVAHARLANLSDPLFEMGLSGARAAALSKYGVKASDSRPGSAMPDGDDGLSGDISDLTS